MINFSTMHPGLTIRWVASNGMEVAWFCGHKKRSLFPRSSPTLSFILVGPDGGCRQCLNTDNEGVIV